MYYMAKYSMFTLILLFGSSLSQISTGHGPARQCKCSNMCNMYVHTYYIHTVCQNVLLTDRIQKVV